MKPLLKIVLVFWVFFTTLLVVLGSTGLVTLEKIRRWLEAARDADPAIAALLVIGLLFADLFIAVPTSSVIILGGYLLGPFAGGLAALSGLLLAGVAGYGISRRYGDPLIRFLIRDEEKRAEAMETFRAHGAIVILLSRAMPLLPEVSACMAGITRMPFPRFLLLWVVSAAPYAAIASYAGSVSTFENPMPAILAVIGLATCFWVGGIFLRRRAGCLSGEARLSPEASRAR